MSVAAPIPTPSAARSRIAVLSRRRPDDAPALAAARADLAAAKIAAAISDAVASAPPLNDAQRAMLHGLLDSTTAGGAR